MSEDRNAEVLVAVFDSFNRHDANGVVAHMTENSVFETVGGPEAYGTRISGREAIRQAFAAVWAQMPDAHWDVTRHTVTGNRAFSEWTFSGTAADGMRIVAEGVDLFTFEDGKIATKRAFRKQRPAFRA